MNPIVFIAICIVIITLLLGLTLLQKTNEDNFKYLRWLFVIFDLDLVNGIFGTYPAASCACGAAAAIMMLLYTRSFIFVLEGKTRKTYWSLLGFSGLIIVFYLATMLGLAPMYLFPFVAYFLSLLTFPLVARFMLNKREISLFVVFVLFVILDAFLSITNYFWLFGIGQVIIALSIYYQLTIKSRFIWAEKRAESFDKINGALASKYGSLFLIDMSEQTVEILKSSAIVERNAIFRQGEVLDYEVFVKGFVDNLVKDDKERMTHELDFDTLFVKMSRNEEYTTTVQVEIEEKNYTFQFIFRNLKGTNKLILATNDIGEILEKEKEQKMALENALEVAREAMQTRTSFLKYMSHDIRIPMNDIIGLTTLASNHIDDKELVSEYLKKIQASSGKLLDLVMKVLDENHFDYEKALEEVKVEETIRQESAKTGDFNATLNGLNILLVEDNEMNREIAQMLLEEYGAKVDALCDGLEVVQRMEYEFSRYDVILMDIEMPILNGYEATKRIRSMANRSKAQTPIIALTANANEEDRKASMDAGMNGHIAKPFDIEKMIEEINRLLK